MAWLFLFRKAQLMQRLNAAQRRQSAAGRIADAIRRGSTQNTPPDKNVLRNNILLEFETLLQALPLQHKTLLWQSAALALIGHKTITKLDGLSKMEMVLL
jgi:hypothetical protein